MKQGIFMRDRAADSKEAVIDIVGVIGWEVWYQAMRDMLRAIPDTIERVIFDIYSPGGDVWEGNAIIQEIGALKQHTIARVQVAASMATLIAVACKERTIAGNGRWLIHNPWTAVQGDAADLEKRAKELRDCEVEAAAFYAARTGQTAEQMLSLMSEERWLTPAEAKELGFVQAINDPFDTAAFAGVRAEIVAAGKWPQALVEPPLLGEPAPEPKPDKENHDGDEKPDGAAPNEGKPAGVAGGAVDAGKPPARSTASEPEGPPKSPAESAAEAFERGRHEGIVAGAETAARAAEELAGEKKQRAAAETASRALQAERDRARAQVEKMEAALKELTARIDRLLAGGLRFSPAVETWADALRVAGGDYEAARKQFPDLFREERERAKANRK